MWIYIKSLFRVFVRLPFQNNKILPPWVWFEALYLSKQSTNLVYSKGIFFFLNRRQLYTVSCYSSNCRTSWSADPNLPKVLYLLPFSCYSGLNQLEANKAILCYCPSWLLAHCTVHLDNSARRHFYKNSFQNLFLKRHLYTHYAILSFIRREFCK